MNIIQTLAPGESADYHETSDFLRVLVAPYPLEIRFYRNGHEEARAEAITEGYAERFTAGVFDQVKIINGATAQTVKIAVRAGNQVNYDRPPTGAVTVANTGGAFAQSTVAVGVASVQLLAANAARRYLLIENKHATVSLYVNLAGAAATVAGGVTLLPGDSLELSSFVPLGAITAIGSGAGASAVVVEG